MQFRSPQIAAAAVVAGVVALSSACKQSSATAESAAAPPAALVSHAQELGASWLLSGSVDERFIRVGAQLRGFDLTMPEVGYRYGALYWAGADRNWDFARYQVGKIATAVQAGLQRRPEHTNSARMLDGALERIEVAIEAEDAALFDARFTELTATCNACHVAERVPFVRVEPPKTRTAPVGSPP